MADVPHLARNVALRRRQEGEGEVAFLADVLLPAVNEGMVGAWKEYDGVAPAVPALPRYMIEPGVQGVVRLGTDVGRASARASRSLVNIHIIICKTHWNRVSRTPQNLMMRLMLNLVSFSAGTALANIVIISSLCWWM